MATHSSILAWEIPRPEETGRPQVHGVMITAYLRLLIFLLAILIPACTSSSPAFCMIHSAYKLNKQGDNIQPWHQFSLSVVSDSLLPHGPKHTRPPCPSPILELAQTHVHWVGDAIQPSHPLSSPSPPAFNLSQSLFQWVSSSHQVAELLEFQLRPQSFWWIFRTDFL